jgi:hypothetical protein
MSEKLQINIDEEREKWLKSVKFANLKRDLETLLDLLPKEEKEKFLEFFSHNDFYYAPASTKYHGNYFGGLLEHSLTVFNEMQSLGVRRDIAIKTALIHDFCKINFYKPKIIKTKNEIGFEIYNDKRMGHGEWSVIVALQNGFNLTLHEMQMIRWHMGFNDKNYSYYSYQNKLLEENDNALRIQFADHISSLGGDE